MFESLADVFRQIGHDERVHKEESLEGFAVASGFFAPNRVASAGLSRHDRVFVRATYDVAV